MSVSSDSAEQLIRLYIDETEFALKITGSAIKNIIAALYVISKDTSKSKGKARLSKMLKTEKELKIFSVKKDDMKIFAREAKSYGVLYCALVNKKNQNIDNMIDIMVRAEDAPKVNRIIERFKLDTVDKAVIKSEIEKEKAEETGNIEQENDLSDSSKDLGVETKDVDDQMIDDIFSKPVKKEEKELPLESQTEKNSPSELSSTNKDKLEGTIKNPEKKSVRKELREIAESQKIKEESKNIEKDKIKSIENPQPIKYTSKTPIKRKVGKKER